MKILVIGTIDNKGGAAQISWELRKRLKADGHEVSTFVRYKYSDEADVFVIPRRRYQDWLVKLFANDLTFSGSNFIFNTKEYREADIIHCHNLHSNFFNLKDLIRMSAEKPVIWTLHDIWALTGFASGSYTRKHPNKKRFLLYLWDNTAFLLKVKEKIYQRSKLTVVAVSDWLKKEIEKSILAKQRIIRIYNGIDTEVFCPGDKEAARKLLGLPLIGKKIIGCGLKGWVEANEIIDSYKDRDDLFFVAIGHDNIRTINKNFAVLPRTEDKAKLATYLQAVDVFFHLTLEDTFGLTAAELLSCGTPIVAYDVDALPEIISHKVTGYIAKYGVLEDVKKGIEYILGLSKEEYAHMQTTGRKNIVERFTSERMYREYLRLYEEIFTASWPKQQKKD
jgi:glycosyltransferase involved in cell wall biosynthesis